MVRRVKLQRMGESVVVTLPQDMLERFQLQAGDEVLVVETEIGILLKKPPGPATTPESPRTPP